MGSIANGVSDHDPQMLELHVVSLNSKRNNYKTITIRKIDFNSINEFKDKLSSEIWQNVFDNDNKDVDSIFNSFLNTYLQIFYSYFPQKKTNNKITSNKPWITIGIINSCKRKKELYLLPRNNNVIQLKEYYMRYSKTLSKVIKTAKTLNAVIKSFILIIKSRQHGTS